MNQSTVLITGATSGIGYQTARALAKRGAHVFVTGRDERAGQSAVDQLRSDSGGDAVDLILADLSTHAGVTAVAQQFAQTARPLDVLINNAGYAGPHRITADGHEMTYAVNVIAPYLLTHLLLDSLRTTGARVITVTGGSHPRILDPTNLRAEHGYQGLRTYSHAKLAMMATMYEMSQRVDVTRFTVNVCYPGQASTAMTQNVTPDMVPRHLRWATPIFRLLTRPDDGKSARVASRSSVRLAAGSTFAGRTGLYVNAAGRDVPWPAAVLDDEIRAAVWHAVEQSASLTSPLNRREKT